MVVVVVVVFVVEVAVVVVVIVVAVAVEPLDGLTFQPSHKRADVDAHAQLLLCFACG